MKSLPHVVQLGCEIFIVSSVGGSTYYFAKGALRSSSKGCRLAGAVQEVITNRPRIRRSAAWFGILAAIYEARMVKAHRDFIFHLNFALAWGGANALFSAHRGTRAAVREGLKGVAYSFVAVLAGVGLTLLFAPPESSSE